jgi:hypothetical protein
LLLTPSKVVNPFERDQEDFDQGDNGGQQAEMNQELQRETTITIEAAKTLSGETHSVLSDLSNHEQTIGVRATREVEVELLKKVARTKVFRYLKYLEKDALAEERVVVYKLIRGLKKSDKVSIDSVNRFWKEHQPNISEALRSRRSTAATNMQKKAMCER